MGQGQYWDISDLEWVKVNIGTLVTLNGSVLDIIDIVRVKVSIGHQ